LKLLNHTILFQLCKKKTYRNNKGEKEKILKVEISNANVEKVIFHTQLYIRMLKINTMEKNNLKILLSNHKKKNSKEEDQEIKKK
jgi:hypothetical protein